MRGNIAVYDLDGKRTHLQSALDRFKRLDGTGSYINSTVGRSNKAHQKTEKHKWHSEQHVFCWFRFDRKLDRMFLAHQKRKRYFVDDPYEKYHKLSFLKYQESLKKNAKNIQVCTYHSVSKLNSPITSYSKTKFEHTLISDLYSHFLWHWVTFIRTEVLASLVKIAMFITLTEI